MTKAQALNKFFSSFSLIAYEEDAVPQSPATPQLPYVTYSLVTDSLGTDVPLTLNLWYRDGNGYSALPDLVRKVEEISQSIGMGGVTIPCDGGAIWIRRGSPFAQYMRDPEDELIRRAYINITAEFLTAD